jgi:hypothetical protein
MVKLSEISSKPDTIFAIDASTTSLAFAIFNNKELISTGKINFEGKNNYEKAGDAAKKCLSFFTIYNNIDAIVIEQVVFLNSPKTLLDLSIVHGAIVGAAQAAGVKKVVSVPPITWQNYLGNKRLTSKEKQDIMTEFPDKSKSWYKSYERELRKQKTIKFINIYYDKEISDNDVADASGIGHYAINNISKLF